MRYYLRGYEPTIGKVLFVCKDIERLKERRALLLLPWYENYKKEKELVDITTGGVNARHWTDEESAEYRAVLTFFDNSIHPDELIIEEVDEI